MQVKRTELEEMETQLRERLKELEALKEYSNQLKKFKQELMHQQSLRFSQIFQHRDHKIGESMVKLKEVEQEATKEMQKMTAKKARDAQLHQLREMAKTKRKEIVKDTEASTEKDISDEVQR